MEEKDRNIIKWFHHVGYRYVDNILTIVNIDKLKQDRVYANKMFFFYWAFERQGAPVGYKIAAIKTLETVNNDNYSLEFFKYYKGKVNKNNNPILDENLKYLDITKVVNKIEKMEFSQAFSDLKLNGIGHKIRAFFIRDIVHLLELEKKGKIEFDDYLFMNPIDIWVKLTVEYLNISKPYNYKNKPIYNLSRDNFNIAVTLTNSCFESNVSPLLTNMGMWYYASHFIADSKRLKEILVNQSVEQLESEMSLLTGFRDIKRTLIE